jgi:pimeloyl-ACP methyl ester carboxylesterase
MGHPIRERELELDGVRTRALELIGSGPPLVLLHGFADSADTWRPLMRELSARGRAAIALDMPGFGAAARLDREADVLPQLDRFAIAAVRHAIADLSPDSRAVVVGNSLGGAVALRIAEHRDLPLAGVVPIAPAGLEMARWLAIIEGEGLLRAVLRSPLPVPDGVVRAVVGRMYRAFAFLRPADVPADVVDAFTGHVRSRRDAIRILATGHRLMIELRDPFELGRIACPVLVVWGDSDIMVLSSGAQRLLDDVPGAALEVIENCGHCPQIEATERVAELLDAFPDELAQAA